jgi:MFS family permease
MIWLTAPAVIVGMCLFGIGFGVVQNATLVLMINHMPAAGVGTASALWNLAYDAGYGAGPVVFGLVAGHTGYPAAFAVTGVLVLAALPASRSQRTSAGTPPTPSARPVWQAVRHYRLRRRRSSTRCNSAATGT